MRAPDHGRERHRIVRAVVEIQHQPRTVLLQGLERPGQRLAFGALDIHLDEMDALDSQVLLQLIERGHRHFDRPVAALLLHHAVHARVAAFAQAQRHRARLAPHAHRRQHHATLGNLLLEIAPQAFEIRGIGLHRHHLRRAGLERLPREHAHMRAAIHHHIPLPHVRFGVRFLVPVMLGQQPPQASHRRGDALRPKIPPARPGDALEVVLLVVLHYLDLAAVLGVELVKTVERRVKRERVAPGALRGLARGLHVHRPAVGQQMR